jgi:hypothetical protein
MLIGTTLMITGFPEGVEKNISQLASEKMKIKIIALTERKYTM